MRTRTSWLLTAARVLAGAVLVLSGLPKLTAPATVLSDFFQWGIPAVAVTVPLVGVLEVVGGTLLVLGLLARPVAAVLAVEMLVALLTAGRIDGGAHLVLPPLVGLACLAVARWGPGPLRLPVPRPARATR